MHNGGMPGNYGTSSSSRALAARDPVSIQFDGGAEQLLAKARGAGRGVWVSTLLADPTLAQARAWGARGIDVTGPDPLPRGGLEARTRWARAFVRALYYNRGTAPIQVEVGRHLPASGRAPAGRQVRLRLRAGGEPALAAVRRLPDSARIYDDLGDPGGRHAANFERDWNE